MDIFLYAILLVVASAAVTFHFTGLMAARITQSWLVRLVNGENLPDDPGVGWRTWLLPVHQEALGLAKKLAVYRSETEGAREKMTELEMTQHFVLGSLIEGIMVVNGQEQITLINSEFLNIYQLQQSPLRQTVREALDEPSLARLIKKVLGTGKVQTDRIRPQSHIWGRPPSFEVSAIPVRGENNTVTSVVVLFLPPPDRPRMTQILKQHNEKVQRLAEEWTVRGRILLRSTVADVPDILAEPEAGPATESNPRESSLKS